MLKVASFIISILGITQISVFSDAATFSRTTTAWLSETDPSATVCGVHLISGHYCFRMVDHVVPGPIPICIERYYNPCSGTEDGFRYFDWNVLSWFRSDENFGGSLIWSSEPSGSSFLYNVQKNKGVDLRNNCLAMEFFRRENCCGVTNTGGQEISGKASLIHRTAYKNQKSFRINLSDGTQRKFAAWAHFAGNQLISKQDRIEHPEPNLRRFNFPQVKIPQKAPFITFSNYPMDYEPHLRKDMFHHRQYYPPPFEKESNYCLEYLEHPNGNATHFAYTDKMEVARISTYNSSKKEKFASITLMHGYWSSTPSHLGRKKMQISTSDNKVFIYHTRLCNGKMVFDHVEGPGIVNKQLEYTWIGEKPLITRIVSPDNRVKEFEFYPKDHAHAGKVKTIKEPAGIDGSIVSTLKIEYPNVHTAVTWNGRGDRTVYQFSKEYRIENVTRFVGKTKEASEEFGWGGEWNTQLIYKTLKDTNNEILLAKHLAYDANGNVLEEQLNGLFTGKSKSRIHLQDQMPIGGDVYTVKRTYLVSYDGERLFNLLSSEDDGICLKSSYIYKPGTNLLTAKLHWRKEHSFQATPQPGQENPLLRELYTYDEDAICIRKSLDDGDSFTERHTTEISPRAEQPGLAMPEMISQTITTPSDKKILHTKKITYGIWHKPVKEEFFDTKDSHAYTLSYTYDNMGNLASSTNALGHTTLYRYDANKNLIETILPHEDHRTTYTYDLMNRLTSVTHAAATESYTITYDYDVCGNLISSTNALGYTTQYEYDQRNRLVKKISPQIIDSKGNILRPTEIYIYNALDQIITIIHPDGTTTTKTYTTRGDPIHIKHPDGTEERFTYRLDGKLEAHTNVLGVTITYTYDTYDNICHTKATSTLGTLLYETSDTYNAFHHLSHTDEQGIKTTYSYNAYGQLECEKTEDIDGRITYGYDTLGRQISTYYYAGSTLQYSQHKTHDLANQVTATWTETSDGLIQNKTTTTYDALGRPTSVTTYGVSGPETTHTSYDALNRPIKITDPLGNETHTTYHCQADPETKLIHITTADSIGRKTNEFYDGCGNLHQITKHGSSGSLILLEKRYYDTVGNLTFHIQDSLTERAPFILEQTYGPNHQLLSTTEAPNTPYEKTTSYTYSKNGLLKTKTKPDGTTLTYTYDALGRIASLTTPNLTYHYTYNKVHCLIKVQDAHGKTLLERSYNNLGSLTRDSYGATLYHTYDACNRLLSTTLPDDTVITYAYNGPNLESSTYKNHTTAVSSRDPSNRITSVTLANSDTITKAYDPCGKLLEISSPHFTQKNTFDNLGRLTYQLVMDPVSIEQTSYTYDDLDQLLSEENSNPQTYTYDSCYNRTSHNNNTCSHDLLNQIESSSCMTPTYNKCGHLVHKQNLDVDLSYTYDDLDRLIKITSPAFTYEFTYDPLDRRITESYQSDTDNHQYTFLYDGQCEIGVLASNKITQLRVPLESIGAEIDGSYLFFLNNKPYYPTYDHRGNLAILADNQLLYAYRYTGYGERAVWACNSQEPPRTIKNDLSPWHFSSKRSIKNTDLTSFGLRDYDAMLGRWLVPDPVEYADGLNLYAYVHNNPTNCYDTWGMWTGEGFGSSKWETDGMLAMAEIGATSFGADPTPFQDARIQINDWFKQGAPIDYMGRLADFCTGFNYSLGALGNHIVQSGHNIAQLNADADLLTYAATKVNWVVALDILSNPDFQNDAHWTAAECYATGPAFVLGGLGKRGLSLYFRAGRRFNWAAQILTKYGSARSAQALSKLEKLATTIGARQAAAKNAASIEKGIAHLFEHNSQLKHIFDQRKGHIFTNSPQKQTEYLRLFYEIASKPQNWRRHPKEMAFNRGVHLFEEKISGLGKVWVHTRDGLLQNGGIEPF